MKSEKFAFFCPSWWGKAPPYDYSRHFAVIRVHLRFIFDKLKANLYKVIMAEACLEVRQSRTQWNQVISTRSRRKP
ncbi:MAG: hypothetical protein MI756_13660 [Chromatiales bacterium]|nr:hypothetical protein [Chromatiales bacterium]